MNSGCTQSTRMGRMPAWRFTATNARPDLMSRAGAAVPLPSACSASIRLHPRKTLLASPRAAPGGEGTWKLRAPPKPHAPIPPGQRRRRTTPARAPAGNAKRTVRTDCHGAPPAYGRLTTGRQRKYPMHLFTRLPPRGRPSEPEADSIDVPPKPHAPIHAAFSARHQPGQATPHVQRSVARPAPPTVSPGVHMRRW
jgi:hypothetical protein